MKTVIKLLLKHIGKILIVVGITMIFLPVFDLEVALEEMQQYIDIQIAGLITMCVGLLVEVIIKGLSSRTKRKTIRTFKTIRRF